jgi:hypothetical protein
MKQSLLILLCMCLMVNVNAQDKKSPAKAVPSKGTLPDIRKAIQSGQQNLSLFTLNYKDHSQEHDVNSIILDIEKYIDSMPRTRTYSDQLLMKHFNPLRHFFLTTTNKTTVATSFLYSGSPYQFCYYNDTALSLYLYAVKDGITYDLGKKTEKRITKSTFENCLLPSLNALDEFKADDIRYVALSVYYGCKDTREGAPSSTITPYCITLLARLSDIQQYGAGLITVKGLLAVSEVYLGDSEDAGDLRRIQVNID